MKISVPSLLPAVLLLAMQASAAPSPAATSFVSPVGISVDPPTGWKTLAAPPIPTELPAGQTRLSDAQITAALKSLAGKPIVEFAKHDEPYRELNPTIQVHVRPLGAFAGKSLDQVMTTVVLPLRKAHPDLQLVGPMKEMTVSGLKALEAIGTYTLTVGPRQFVVRSRLWVVPRGELFFVIAMSDPPKGPDVAEREFRAALTSIHIDP